MNAHLNGRHRKALTSEGSELTLHQQVNTSQKSERVPNGELGDCGDHPVRLNVNDDGTPFFSSIEHSHAFLQIALHCLVGIKFRRIFQPQSPRRRELSPIIDLLSDLLQRLR